MKKIPRTLSSSALCLFTFCVLTVSGCKPQAQPAIPTAAAKVTVAKPVVKQIVEWDAYTGRLEAIDFVEIRARVSGYLKSIHFDEGQVVSKGDLLLVIDPRPFEAALNGANAAQSQSESRLQQAKAQRKEAEAMLQQSQAQMQLAESNIRRARTLRPSNAITQEELDRREAEFLQAKADVEASKARISSATATIVTAAAAIELAKADVEIAELNLDYTRVLAPVNGRISREIVTEGNLVSGGDATSTLLTTITSVEPIYCTFDANEQDVLKYTRLALSGQRESSRVAKNPVYLGLVDEVDFPHEGHMDFVDNRFDPDTASMRARCVFPNEDQVLIPGMFARIRIPGSAAYEAVLIPDSAIGTDQSSKYVYIVDDGSIQRRSVSLGPMVDGLRVVRKGLTGNESLVMEGLLQARPGMGVEIKAGVIEVVEDGLPNHYEPLPPDKWISPRPDPIPEVRESQTQADSTNRTRPRSDSQ